MKNIVSIKRQDPHVDSTTTTKEYRMYRQHKQVKRTTTTPTKENDMNERAERIARDAKVYSKWKNAPEVVITFDKEYGEYRVPAVDGNEDDSYHCTDVEDAMNTAKVMHGTGCRIVLKRIS